MNKNTNYNFNGLSDIDLILLQHKAKEYAEDKEFREEILRELGRRDKERNKNNV